MSEYMKITGGGPADIIGTASLISGAAEALRSDMSTLIADIQALETPGVIGGDDFAKDFTKSYEESTPISATESGKANVVTQDSAKSLAEQALQIGDAATGAMSGYLLVDGEGAADIGSVTT